ncbi:hypothetical protein [Nitrincola sp. MINF-07-Sa-05]|uniref:hypothetical protein n=1 Tax=Nitrincola salilacus TaxID=3400273 RepID=UPI003917B7BC
MRSTQRKLVESQFKPDLKRVLDLVLLTLIIFALYGWFAALFRSTLLNNPRALLTMQRGFAAAFVLIAIQLVLSALT